MRKHLLSGLILLVPASASAQAQRTITPDDYARAERFLGTSTYPLVAGVPDRPAWLPDGRAWYRVSTADGSEFVMVDPAAGTRAPAFDHARLAKGLSEAMERPVESARLPFLSFELSSGGDTITFATGGGAGRWMRGGGGGGGQRWACVLASYACAKVEDAGGRQAPPPWSVVSPDGRLAAFIRDYDLWARDLESGEETQLTTGGAEDFGYATNNAGWVRSEMPVLTWSPDSRRIATFQHDGRGVSRMYLVRTKVGEPELEAWRYPLPGDTVIFRVQRVVIDIDAPDAPRVVRLRMPPDAHRSMVTDHIACGTDVCDLLWYPDGSRLAFVSSSRDHKHAWVRVADATTGEVRTLFEESSETQIGDAAAVENWRLLPDSDELIWWSERDGWVHLYLYDLETGTLKNRITTGEGNVERILRVDEETRQVWFTGQGFEAGRDPYFSHLYRVGLDGEGMTLLTPEDAHHSVSLAPDGRAFLDTYSTPDTPPVMVLRDGNGEKVAELERADISRLLATGWRPPTPVTVKGRDGTTDIYGLMFTPTALDSTVKHPVVTYIYPAPSGSVGSRGFSPARGDHQALAELGFVVVQLDGMGTNGRSKAFRDVPYGRMGDNTVPDQVAGLRELAERHPWIDIDRVGIWGHSGGGFATAAAMFRYPDFFKVGVAQSGNHDNRNYEDDWGERYQGLLVRDGESDNYEAEANQTRAADLKGHLLLAHGGMDGNVPPYNTLLVVDALIKANKDFDLLIFPNAGHGYGRDNTYMMRRRWDYFVRHLLGAEPPREYEFGSPRPGS